MTTIQEARERYLHDPAFHACVKRTVVTLEHDTGIKLNPQDRSLATDAAAVALMVAETVYAS